jgi:alpha-tubulin suppressor-like RCC1 family protein
VVATSRLAGSSGRGVAGWCGALLGVPSRARAGCVLLAVAAALLLAAGSSSGSVGAALDCHAPPNPENTRCDPWGTVELAGSVWLGGAGVKVFSNGADATVKLNCNGHRCWQKVGGVKSGVKWLSAELVNRLYLSRHWLAATWAGRGDQLFDNAPARFEKEAQGAIGGLAPGDVISLAYPSDPSLGLAAIVASVTRNVDGSVSAQLVTQNADAVFGSATLTTDTLTVTGGLAGYRVVGVVHRPFARVSAGFYFTCGVTSGGAAKCWGSGGDGQLGNGNLIDSDTPVDVVGLSSDVVDVSSSAPFGSGHTCALTTAGAVYCWGLNGSGQLGDGTQTTSATPVPVVGLSSGVAAISTGQDSTCAVTSGGSAFCWGGNESGQLGDGTTASSSVPVAVAGLSSGVASISTGGRHSCAVTNGGGVECWGANDSGQLGDGTTNDSLTPVAVVGLASGVATVSAGSSHTCAVTTAGAAKCWGSNGFGKLGDGSGADSPVPVSVVGLASGVASIRASEDHTCAATSDGSAKCWGYNEWGELGNGTKTTSVTPVQVARLSSGVKAITAGYNHSCAVIATGAKCWGNNYSGELGYGVPNGTTSKPVTVLDFG